MRISFFTKVFVIYTFCVLPAAQGQSKDQLKILINQRAIAFAIFPTPKNIESGFVPLTNIGLAVIDPNSTYQFHCVPSPTFGGAFLQFRIDPIHSLTSIAHFKDGNDPGIIDCNKTIPKAQQIFEDAKSKGRWIALPESNEFLPLRDIYTNAAEGHYAYSIEDFFTAPERILGRLAELPNSVSYLEQFFSNQAAYYQGTSFASRHSDTTMKYWNPTLIKPRFYCKNGSIGLFGDLVHRLYFNIGGFAGPTFGLIEIAIHGNGMGTGEEACNASARQLNKAVSEHWLSAKKNGHIMKLGAEVPYLTEVKDESVWFENVSIPNVPSLLEELSN